MSKLNLNIPKLNWDGVEDPTINNYYKIDGEEFVLFKKSANRPKSTTV